MKMFHSAEQRAIEYNIQNHKSSAFWSYSRFNLLRLQVPVW